MQKLFILIAALVVAGALGFAGWLALKPTPGVALSDAMFNVDGADIGGPFELVSHTGQTVTDKQVIDRPTLMYFGYTFCPDICPVDVQVMSDAVELLAEKNIEVRPTFVTVDPERDTPEELAVYVEAMNPKMIALTGSATQIRDTADAFKVYYNRVDIAGSAAEYLMQHTGYTYLMVPDKGLVALFKNGFPPEQIAADVERVLAAH